jgi:protein ImuB
MYGCLHSPHPLPQADVLVELARAFTPRCEPLGPRELALDLRGLGRSWPRPEDLGRALVEAGRGRGLELNVALASTRLAAILLARARPGLTVVPPGGEAAALAPVELAVGSGLESQHETVQDLTPLLPLLPLLLRWGLRTFGDLARLPAVGLAERFGPDGPRLLRLARGEDEAPLVPLAPPERYELSLELDWPVDGLEPLSFLLARLLEPLCARLRGGCRRAAGLDLELRLVDASVHRRGLRPAAPTAEPRTWRTLLLLDLEAHPPRDAIQGLCVRAWPTPARSVQFSLLDPAQPSPERLAETLARLHEWTAAGRGGAALLLDTHRPGAYALGTFAPGPAARAPFATTPRLALRVFRPPLLARVALRDAAPAAVAFAGVRGAVVERAGPWRASGGWWDDAWSREEWDVALGGGGLYRIFYDRMRSEWFAEGELD